MLKIIPNSTTRPTLPEILVEIKERRELTLRRIGESVSITIVPHFEMFTYIERRTSPSGGSSILATSPRPLSELADFIGGRLEVGFEIDLDILYSIYHRRWIDGPDESLTWIRIEFRRRAQHLLSILDSVARIEPRINPVTRDPIVINDLENLIRKYLEIRGSDELESFNDFLRIRPQRDVGATKFLSERYPGYIIEYTRKLLKEK